MSQHLSVLTEVDKRHAGNCQGRSCNIGPRDAAHILHMASSKSSCAHKRQEHMPPF